MKRLRGLVMGTNGGDQAHVCAVLGQEGGMAGGDIGRRMYLVDACASLQPVDDRLVGHGA